MVTKQRRHVFNPPQFQGTSIVGTEQKFAIDRTWPIEEIHLVVSGTVSATAFTGLTTDGMLGVVKKVTLAANDGTQPRNVVDYSGIGLLEYCANAGLNLDAASLEVVKLQLAGTITASVSFRLTYRIPLVHPMIQEPLRTRMLLPAHNWDQDLNLSIQFASNTEIGSAGSFSALSTEVVLVRRVMPESLNQQILSSGGYIPFDLIEQPYSIGVGISGEQRINIPSPGSYLNLNLRSYKGGSTVTRDVIDAVTTLGSETKWTLTSGGVTEQEFRFKHIQTANEFSRPINAISNTSSPVIGGAVAANTAFRPASSIMLDFMGDGLNDANELGSTLDLNLPQKSGLKMELVGSVSSASTNGHVLFVGGHRLYGDLTRWQSARGL